MHRAAALVCPRSASEHQSPATLFAHRCHRLDPEAREAAAWLNLLLLQHLLQWGDGEWGMARRHTARAALVALEPCDRPQHWETVVHSVAVHEVMLMETDLGKE